MWVTHGRPCWCPAAPAVKAHFLSALTQVRLWGAPRATPQGVELKNSGAASPSLPLRRSISEGVSMPLGRLLAKPLATLARPSASDSVSSSSPPSSSCRHHQSSTFTASMSDIITPTVYKAPDTTTQGVTVSPQPRYCPRQTPPITAMVDGKESLQMPRALGRRQLSIAPLTCTSRPPEVETQGQPMHRLVSQLL